jgi:hypothetical protein
VRNLEARLSEYRHSAPVSLWLVEIDGALQHKTIDNPRSMAYIRGLLEAAWSYRCLRLFFIKALQH